MAKSLGSEGDFPSRLCSRYAFDLVKIRDLSPPLGEQIQHHRQNENDTFDDHLIV